MPTQHQIVYKVALLRYVPFYYSSGQYHSKAFGPQLDSLIDIVSFGVFPAIFLLSYGSFSPIYLPGAFLILATAAIRLSYFKIGRAHV